MPTDNRPGLAALDVRIGTHGSFLATMKARLSSHALGKGPAITRPLAGLRVRDADASVALLDAFATMADVLTFYQERIVNEGYLGPATEMRSVHELARLVGYAPRPGVAAGAWLSYTLDANVPEKVLIASGSRVRSVPGPGELPQIFETSDDLIARSAWNRLGVRQTEPPRWEEWQARHALYLAGTSTGLRPGDPLLVAVDADRPRPYRLIEVEADADLDRTRIALKPWSSPVIDSSLTPKLQALRAVVPGGETVKPIAERLDRLAESFVGGLEGLMRVAEDQAFVQTVINGAPTNATVQIPWARQVHEALGEMMVALEQPPAGPECRSEGLIGRLTVPPSAPPASALMLGASLECRFEEAGDAGLALLASASPDLREHLAAGMSGCVAQTPRPRLTVYALRLRSNLFGHNFPKQRRTLLGDDDTDGRQASRTVEVGEWPIVTVEDVKDEVHDATGEDLNTTPPRLVYHESPQILSLEASHDAVVANSWIFIDSTGAQRSDDEMRRVPTVAVEPPQPWLVTRINAVQPKVTRADYGGSAETTRIRIDPRDSWIRFASDPPLRALVPEQPVIDQSYKVVRGTVVYAMSEALPLAPTPIAEPVCGGTGSEPIELDGLYLDLEPGRHVIVTGDRSDIDNVEGVTGVEAAMIADVVHDVRAALPVPTPWTRARRAVENGRLTPAQMAAASANADSTNGGAVDDDRDQEEPPDKLAGDTLHTFLWLEKPLAYCYRRAGIAIHANVVKATHGETHEETLGNGDGGQANQSFALKHSPLTYLPSPTPVGATDSLQVFVNDIRWKRVASFVDLPPTARAYVIRTDHAGNSSVVFGDGGEGARLPTGTLNVAATYRSGLGRAGNVRAGQIQQLVTRPLGVKEVVNPFRASGGADAESRDQARRNAPLAASALGRLVATRDYADFARTFAGIAKADARELSDGMRSIVHVTLAGLDDAPLDPDTDLLVALRRAYRDLGDPFQAVAVEPRELRLLIVEAGLRIDPDRRWEIVAAAVREALFDAFGFERRELGEGVASSEVLNVIQGTAGVAMADIDHFGAVPTAATGSDGRRRPLTPAETAAQIEAVIKATKDHGVATKVDARRARRENGRLLPAELVLLSREVPASIVINQVGGQ